MDNDGAQGADDGAAAGGSGESGSKKFVPPSDGSWIPKVRHDEAVNAERARLARVEAELAALKQAQVKATEQPVKKYTRQEVNAAVASQAITAEQAEDILAKQLREDAIVEAERRILGKVEAKRAQERVDTDLEEYKRLDPSIMEEGSETRQRVREEFEYLVGLGNEGAAGNPKTLQTQLLAIRAVLGPLDKLRTAKSARRETESHEETGGSTGSGQRRTESKGAWDKLDQRQKSYYEAAIREGLYKDRKAVEAELSYTRKPNSPRRSGARG
jgi:hypothetical protein